MKNKIYYLLPFFLIIACQKLDVRPYEEKIDGIQFKASASELNFEYNFAIQMLDAKKKTALGDSLLRDTLYIPVSVMGAASEVDRQIFFKQGIIKQEDVELKMPVIEFIEPTVIRAGRLVDTVMIILPRPQERQTQFGVKLTFDNENQFSVFVNGAHERQSFILKVTDKFENPPYWRGIEGLVGEYSFEKHAFLITVLGTTDLSNGGMINMNRQKLINALLKYNSEHTGAPKDFTFPFMPR